MYKYNRSLTKPYISLLVGYALLRRRRQRRTCRLVVTAMSFVCLLLVYELINVGKDGVQPSFMMEQDELTLVASNMVKQGRCTMNTCFNHARCTGDFKIYVYPQNNVTSSKNYEGILQILRQSRYYTRNAEEACIFIPNVDTTDRDKLSVDFQRDLERQLELLAYWNGGENHVVFNVYSGTYPDYKDVIDINIGKAILAKASVSTASFREHFDISLPLFSKNHETYSEGYLPCSEHVFPVHRRYLASFKGKRYLRGIGSETRNALWKINNGRNILLLTTCKHGKDWQQLQDQWCARDDQLYESYDYNEMLRNSTFCLAPRGRRLGSFRFLESLSVSCIPVLLANGYELPFSEVIDWNKAIIKADERRLHEIELLMKEKKLEDILFYRQQNQFLWNAYFSSLEKIVNTVLEIIRERVQTKTNLFSNYEVWNTFPGRLVSLGTQIPAAKLDNSTLERFTTILVVKHGHLEHLVQLAWNISQSKYFDKLLVLCSGNEISLRNDSVWPERTVFIRTTESISSLDWSNHVTTNALFMLNDIINISSTSVDLGFSLWKEFPNRIVGMYAGSHVWNDEESHWNYAGQSAQNGYSMISLSTASFYHCQYNKLYSEFFTMHIRNEIQYIDGCFDLAMNFLVAHVTRLPPIRIQHFDGDFIKESRSHVEVMTKNACFKLLTTTFHYVPLLYSNITFINDAN